MLRFEIFEELLAQSGKVVVAILSRSRLSNMHIPNQVQLDIIRQLSQGPFLLHALATPVSSLLITIELCSEHLQKSQQHPETRELLNQARQNARYLQRIIVASRQLTTAHRSRFKLKPAIQEVVTRFNQPWNGQSLIATIALADSLMVRGHAFFLQEALSCLLTNAFEAYGSKRKRTVLLTCYRHQSNVVIQISDLGSGMDWLTNRLATHTGLSTKGEQHGHGLRFVKFVSQALLRGKLHVQSIKELGTVVTIIIPLSGDFNHG